MKCLGTMSGIRQSPSRTKRLPYIVPNMQCLGTMLDTRQRTSRSDFPGHPRTHILHWCQNHPAAHPTSRDHQIHTGARHSTQNRVPHNKHLGHKLSWINTNLLSNKRGGRGRGRGRGTGTRTQQPQHSQKSTAIREYTPHWSQHISRSARVHSPQVEHQISCPGSQSCPPTL